MTQTGHGERISEMVHMSEFWEREGFTATTGYSAVHERIVESLDQHHKLVFRPQSSG